MMENEDFDEWGSVKLGFICKPFMCEIAVGGLAKGYWCWLAQNEIINHVECVCVCMYIYMYIYIVTF